MKKPSSKMVLDTPLGENDAQADTIRNYLIILLQELWIREEEFSGKRPFGNGGWKYDIAAALISEGLLYGKLDIDGYVEDYDEDSFNEFMLDAICALK
jgi:hypothetical protein